MYSGICGIAVIFLFLSKLGRHFFNISLTDHNLRAILYSSNSINLLRGISCHHCMYFYSGIGSIKFEHTLKYNALNTCMVLQLIWFLDRKHKISKECSFFLLATRLQVVPHIEKCEYPSEYSPGSSSILNLFEFQ